MTTDLRGWRCIIGGVMTEGGAVAGGVDYSETVDFQAIRVYLTNRARGSHASLTVTIANKEYQRPRSLQLVVIYNATTERNLFAGIIQMVAQVEVNGFTYDYNLTLSDLTRQLDHTPAGSNVAYPGDTTSETRVDLVVKQIVTDWVNPGSSVVSQYAIPAPSVPIFTNARVGVIGVFIAYYYPNFTPVSQAIDYLARLANCIWFVDANADLWFVDPEDASIYAPISNLGTLTFYDQQQQLTKTFDDFPIIDVEANALNVGGVFVGDYRNLVLTEDASATISGVLVQNFQELSTTQITENPTSTPNANPKLKGDGITQFFALNYEPAANAKYMTVTAKINGSTVTFSQANGNLKIEYVDGDPSEGPTTANVCYINSPGQGIRFNGPTNNPGTTVYGAPDSGQNLTVVYNRYIPGYYPQAANTQLAFLIKAREGFGGGRYYDIIGDPSLTTPLTLADGTTAWAAAAQLDLDRNGLIKIQANFSSYTDGWMPGQIFGITSTSRGDIFDDSDTEITGWGSTFAQRFFVNDVTISIVNDTTCNYDISASSNIWGT